RGAHAVEHQGPGDVPALGVEGVGGDVDAVVREAAAVQLREQGAKPLRVLIDNANARLLCPHRDPPRLLKRWVTSGSGGGGGLPPRRTDALARALAEGTGHNHSTGDRIRRGGPAASAAARRVRRS